jgi:hypothetical protein
VCLEAVALSGAGSVVGALSSLVHSSSDWPPMVNATSAPAEAGRSHGQAAMGG